MNPPYGQAIEHWMKKAFESSRSGALVVCLVPARTDTRTEHSTKPDKIREFLERASPGPRIELFGRRTSPEWTVFGGQIQRYLF